MKTIQKLEIGFGLATLVGTLAYFCIFLPFYFGKKEDSDIYREIFFSALPTIVPGLMVGIGSVAHSARQRSVGLYAVLFGGGVLVLLFGVGYFGFLAGAGWVGFILASPGWLAAITMYCAGRSEKLVRNENKRDDSC